MKALKFAIAFMGVMIVGLLVLLGYGLYTKAGRTSKASTQEAPLAMTNSAGVSEIVLDEPEGSTVGDIRLDGKTLAMVVHGSPERGERDRVIVIDLRDGKRVATVRLGEKF